MAWLQAQGAGSAARFGTPPATLQLFREVATEVVRADSKLRPLLGVREFEPSSGPFPDEPLLDEAARRTLEV